MGRGLPANKMIGVATLDRLRHGAYPIVLDGDSYRRLRPSPDKFTPPVKGKGRAAEGKLTYTAPLRSNGASGKRI